jgi:hypothetical protein
MAAPRPSSMALRLVLALLLGIPGVLIATASPAHACSCVGGPAGTGVRGADVLFLGTVAEDRGGNLTQRTLTFEVERVWKGETPATTQIRTGSGGGDCGLEIGDGDEAVVFAYREDDTLASNICSSHGATRSDVERLLGTGTPPDDTEPAPEPFLGLLVRWFSLWF